MRMQRICIFFLDKVPLSLRGMCYAAGALTWWGVNATSQQRLRGSHSFWRTEDTVALRAEHVTEFFSDYDYEE